MYKDKRFQSYGQPKKSGYMLTKQIFKMAKAYPGTIKPHHIALYIWLCEINNMAGWSNEKISVPTSSSMAIIGMKNRRYYIRTLNELESFGLIKIVYRSKNQYHATRIVLLVINDFQTDNYNNERNTLESQERNRDEEEFWRKNGFVGRGNDDDDGRIMEMLPDGDNPNEEEE